MKTYAIPSISAFPRYVKSIGKHKQSEMKSFLNILLGAEIHKIPKIKDELITIAPKKNKKKYA